jgi:hypothetical protein
MAEVTSYESLQRARDLIDAQYALPLDLDELARTANFSRYHFDLSCPLLGDAQESTQVYSQLLCDYARHPGLGPGRISSFRVFFFNH